VECRQRASSGDVIEAAWSPLASSCQLLDPHGAPITAVFWQGGWLRGGTGPTEQGFVLDDATGTLRSTLCAPDGGAKTAAPLCLLVPARVRRSPAPAQLTETPPLN
jgi:hypothetical protein